MAHTRRPGVGRQTVRIVRNSSTPEPRLPGSRPLLKYELEDLLSPKREGTGHGRAFAVLDDPRNARYVIVVPVRDEHETDRLTRLHADALQVLQGSRLALRRQTRIHEHPLAVDVDADRLTEAAPEDRDLDLIGRRRDEVYWSSSRAANRAAASRAASRFWADVADGSRRNLTRDVLNTVPAMFRLFPTVQ